MSTTVDYKSAGVDIEAGNEAVRRIKSHTASTHSPAVLTGVGSFGTLFSLRDAIAGMADPIMVQSTDGVGTKTKVAVMAGRYEALGRDLVAAVAGDIAVMGARPLTFLDYLGFHKTDPAIVEALVSGMSAACREAGIALVGGETAEMPAVYAEGDLDVVGFITGVVDRDKLISGARRRSLRRQFDRPAHQRLVARTQTFLRAERLQTRRSASRTQRRQPSRRFA
jgi:phosphoribosylformylglycinamidine cyclo-ligase